MQIAQLIQADLVVLANESKKKHVDIKEAADRLSYHLRTLKDKSATDDSSSINEDLLQSDELTRPFTLACESKNVKLVTIGIQCIQRLLQNKLAMLDHILRIMLELSGQTMELQLKVLQILLPLVGTYADIHESLLADVFQICFKLIESKFPVVSNTAAATIRQLVVLIFDKVSIEDELIGSSFESNVERPALHDAILLLQDLCCLFAGEQGSFLKVASLPKQLVLELLEAMFTNHTTLVKRNELITSVLKTKIAQIIIKQFSEKNDFPSLIRLLRLTQVLIKQYHDILVNESKILMSLYMRLIEVNNAIAWPRSIVFEALRDIVSDFSTLKSLFKAVDLDSDGSKSVSDVFSCFQKCVFECLGPLSLRRNQELKDPGAEPYMFSLAPNAIKLSCLEQLDKTEAPATSEFYTFYLIITSIRTMIDGLSLNCLPFISNRPLELSDTEREDYLLLLSFLRANWSSILAILALLLTAPLDEDVFNIVLNSMERLSIIVGLLGLSQERDACIFAICKACIPGIKPSDVNSPSSYTIGLSKIQSSTQLTDRNVICIKALINIANNLSSILEVNSFVMILDFLQCADAMIHCGKLEKKELESPVKATRIVAKMDNNFMSVLTSIKKLLDAFQDLKAAPYESMTEAFGILIRETNAGSIQNKEKAVDDKNFGALKLHTILMANMQKAATSETLSEWRMTTRLLISLLQHGNITAGLRAHLCGMFLEYVVAVVQASNTSGDQSRQEALLLPIQQLMIVQSTASEWTDEHTRINASTWFTDIQKCGLDTLNKVIETSGQNLAFGWQIIFDILMSVSSRIALDSTKERSQIYGILGKISIDEYLHSTAAGLERSELPRVKEQLIRAAFPSIQLICNDFLQTLNASTLYACIESLGALGSQDADLNISLTAIGLLWTVSDHILSRRQALPAPTETPSNRNSNKYANVDLHGPQTTLTMDALWISILAFLSILSSDQRPAVRNSANQTLFRSININGARLTLDSWEECVLNILLPLIKRVHFYSENISGKDVDIEDEQSGSKIMVHHSRNSASKQWDETKMLVLSGILKVLSDHFFKLEKIPELMNTTWPIMMKYVHDWIVHGSLEVAMSSIKQLRVLARLPVEKVDDITSQDMHERMMVLWSQLWKLWTDIIINIQRINDSQALKHVYEANQFICNAPVISRGPFAQELMIALLSLSSDLYATLRLEFRKTQLLELYQNVIEIIGYHTITAALPDGRYRSDIKDIDTLSPLQTQAFDMLFSDVTKYDHIDGYQEIAVSTMATLVAYPFDESAQSSTLTFIALSKRCIIQIVPLFESYEKRSEIYNHGVYSHLIQSFSVPMSRKHSFDAQGKDTQPLWKYAAKSFMTLIRQGLLQIDGMRGLNLDMLHSIYGLLLSNMKSFLLYERYQHTISPLIGSVSKCSPDDAILNEEFDISVLTIIESEIVQYMDRKYITEAHVESLVDIYNQGSKFYTIVESGDVIGVSRDLFAKASLQLLFASCSASRIDNLSARLRIARISAPLVIEKAKSVIGSYIDYKKCSGKVPAPRIKSEELKFFLDHISNLDLIPCILIPEQNPSARPSLELRIKAGPKAHLFSLYHTLVDLLSVLANHRDDQEEDIITSLQDALHKIGREIE